MVTQCTQSLLHVLKMVTEQFQVFHFIIYRYIYIYIYRLHVLKMVTEQFQVFHFIIYRYIYIYIPVYIYRYIYISFFIFGQYLLCVCVLQGEGEFRGVTCPPLPPTHSYCFFVLFKKQNEHSKKQKYGGWWGENALEP